MTSSDGELYPRAVQALATKFPTCLCDSLNCCHWQGTRSMMSKILELITVHPKYSKDDGEEDLWEDLTKAAVAAMRKKKNVLGAINTFLNAVLQEIPEEPLH